MKDRVRFNVPCEAKQAMRNRQNVNVSVAFCDSCALDFFDIKLTIGIMYTNLIGTKDVLRLI
jgi:hypothetical protein